MTRIIDADEALAILERVVAAKGPEYIYHDEYDSCAYVMPDNGDLRKEPVMVKACIIGHAMVDGLGIAIDAIAEQQSVLADVLDIAGFTASDKDAYIPPDLFVQEALGSGDVERIVSLGITDDTESFLAEQGVELTEAAARIWLAAQYVQDDNNDDRSWGQALQVARLVHAALASGSGQE